MTDPPTKNDRPPVYTALVELTGWTMDRTASFPKSQRHTFGQRLDNLCLDALMLCVRATFTGDREAKRLHLEELNLVLEQLRVLWRLVADRKWISLRQCLHANERIDEIGRMTGGWIKSLRGGPKRKR